MKIALVFSESCVFLTVPQTAKQICCNKFTVSQTRLPAENEKTNSFGVTGKRITTKKKSNKWLRKGLYTKCLLNKPRRTELEDLFWS